MHRKLLRVAFLVSFILVGCGLSAGRSSLLVNSGTFLEKYEAIKEVVLQEARNNGFSQLTLEVRPSPFNNGKGKLHFTVQTPHGIDQLLVEFREVAGMVQIEMRGYAVRADPKSAMRAIEARLRGIVGGVDLAASAP